jgi:hypothetical protein
VTCGASGESRFDPDPDGPADHDVSARTLAATGAAETSGLGSTYFLSVLNQLRIFASRLFMFRTLLDTPHMLKASSPPDERGDHQGVGSTGSTIQPPA